MQEANPFEFDGVVRSLAFAPRASLEQKLEGIFENRGKVVVQGPRRVGKTSLVVNQFEGRKDVVFIWIDFLLVASEAAACDRVDAALERAGRTSSILEKTIGRIASFQVAGMGLGLHRSEARTGLDRRLQALEPILKKTPTVLFLDEFQSLLELPNAMDVLARLRRLIQDQLRGAMVVFGGSDQNALREIFFSSRHAFFKSATVLEVGPLPRETFLPWIQRKFRKGRREIANERLEGIFAAFHEVPGDIQWFCWELWQQTEPGDSIGAEHEEAAIEAIIRPQKTSFVQHLEACTPGQRNVLIALAAYPGTAYSSAEFVRMSRTSSASVAIRTLQSLEKRGLVWQAGKSYRFSNPFLRIWIESEASFG